MEETKDVMTDSRLRSILAANPVLLELRYKNSLFFAVSEHAINSKMTEQEFWIMAVLKIAEASDIIREQLRECLLRNPTPISTLLTP